MGTYDQWCKDVAIFGEPAINVEKLRGLERDFQAVEIICWFNQGGLIPIPRSWTP